MKKYNAQKICDRLHNAFTKEFTVENDMVVYAGIDQVEPITDSADFCKKMDELEAWNEKGSRKHKAGGWVDYVKDVLTRRGWNVQVYLTIREDGLVSLIVCDNHHTKSELGFAPGENLPEADTEIKVKRNNTPVKSTKKTSKKKGVIVTIVECITNERMTREQILENLIVAFPERNAESMAKTIKVQVPNRIKREKKVQISETEKGFKIV